MQTALPLVLALTFPSRAGTAGYGALDAAAAGLLADANRGALIAIATMFVSGLLNLAYVGPATTSCMRERKHQGEWLPSLFFSLFFVCRSAFPS